MLSLPPRRRSRVRVQLATIAVMARAAATAATQAWRGAGTPTSTSDTSGDMDAARALRASEERFRLVAETTGTMIYDYDLVAGTVYRSEALRSVFRWNDAEPTESWWVSHVHPDDRERLGKLVNPVLRSADGPARWSAEYRWCRGDDVYVHVLERGSVQRDETGHPVRCIGTVTDISDRAELALQLRQAQKMEAVGQLAGGIAHDFNNLLTAISCNVELLLDDMLPEDAHRDDVLQIRDAAARAGALTSQLLAYSRRQVLQPRPLDLNLVVASIERMLRRVLGGDARLSASLSSDLPLVHADAGQMEQVLMNLVLNARDAMPAGGTIVVLTGAETLDAPRQHRFGVLAEGEYATLAVQDSGVGISDDILERLFEPFFTTKGQGKGTGLGLATVHGIIAQSEGQIVLDTTVGSGSRFTIYLPAHRGARHAEPPVPAVRAQRRSGVQNVLVVDDETAVREVCMRAIARAGYRVIGASSAADALALLEREPDPAAVLMLTDIVMPEMNGLELADRVVAQYPGVRIATMSGFSADELTRHGLSSPQHPLIRKPFSLPALLDFVADAGGAAE